MPVSEVEWGPLNPARGDDSPLAGTLWGDRNAPGATGFLFRPTDGFESPPHIHNVSYRGVVIRGVVHNDDPNAAQMWMPVGSFWTQPKGEVHITAAEGSDTLAYIEIDEGPYLVHPADEAFESGQKPVNVDASNVVWVESGADGPQLAFLWGDPAGDQPGGALVKLRAGSSAAMHSPSSTFRAVVIQGRPEVAAAGGTGMTALDPGSLIDATAGDLQVACESQEDCVMYVRTPGRFSVGPGA